MHYCCWIKADYYYSYYNVFRVKKVESEKAASALYIYSDK